MKKYLGKCEPWVEGEDIGGVSDNKLQKGMVSKLLVPQREGE